MHGSKVLKCDKSQANALESILLGEAKSLDAYLGPVMRQLEG